jgi:hypothetical protein
MINLPAAAVLVRELTEEHLGYAPRPGDAAPRAARDSAPSASSDRPRLSWLRRVASGVTRSEERWPRRRSRTSAC